MKIILKILAAPIVVLLTPIVALLSFLFCYAAKILNIISGVGVLLGVITLITAQTVNGCIILFLSFLLSPFGIPAIAEWFIDKLDGLNYSLKSYISS